MRLVIASAPKYSDECCPLSADCTRSPRRRGSLQRAQRLCRVGFLLGFGFLAIGRADAGEATIAVAANFRATAEVIARQLEAISPHQYRVIAGSTGKLAGQIINGAPFDVLMAADTERPLVLAERGLARAESMQVYALGQLGLWWPGAPAKVTPTDILTLAPGTVCIANSKVAPYGRAAEEVLSGLGATPEWISQTIKADNISMVTAMVMGGFAQAGMVARSSLAEIERSGELTTSPTEIMWFDQRFHRGIEQGMILLERGRENPAALQWVEYMRSKEVANLLRLHGYDHDMEIQP